ncbi:hypothetical protein ACFZDF_30660 [Streptomyces sp. NPDC007910]|uniref:hypothetical protein n=1 Tax=Streptomyces sp. NPDC007910 TaxID=3364790 RepID=UPI0036E95272
MSDTEAAGEPVRCPDCGQPVIYDVVDTTAMGGGGRERQKGAAICANEDCAMYGQRLNIG